MRAVIDTNIILDILLNREQFADLSYEVLKIATQKDIEPLVSVSSITDIHYVVKRNSNEQAAKDAITRLAKLITMVDTQPGDIKNALKSEMRDFEDAVLASVAKRQKAECIVTRNAKDFAQSPITAISPEDFIKKYGQ